MLFFNEFETSFIRKFSKCVFFGNRIFKQMKPNIILKRKTVITHQRPRYQEFDPAACRASPSGTRLVGAGLVCFHFSIPSSSFHSPPYYFFGRIYRKDSRSGWGLRLIREPCLLLEWIYSNFFNWRRFWVNGQFWRW